MSLQSLCICDDCVSKHGEFLKIKGGDGIRWPHDPPRTMTKCPRPHRSIKCFSRFFWIAQTSRRAVCGIVTTKGTKGTRGSCHRWAGINTRELYMCSVVRDDPIHYSFFVLEALKIIKFWGGQRNKFLEIQMTQSSKKRFVELQWPQRVFIGKSRFIFCFFPGRKILQNDSPANIK